MGESEVRNLLDRLTAVEDRLAILDLLAGSAHSSDVASGAYWSSIYADDAAMDRGAGRARDLGKESILAIVNGADQQAAIDAGMSHLAMLPRVRVEGDRATATGYLLVVVPDPDGARVVLPGKGTSPGLSIYQLTVNRWELVRAAGGWQVTKRVVRPIAAEDAREILSRGLVAGDATIT